MYNVHILEYMELYTILTMLLLLERLLLEKLQKERTAVHLGVKMLQHQLLQEKGKVKMLVDQVQAYHLYELLQLIITSLDFCFLPLNLIILKLSLGPFATSILIPYCYKNHSPHTYLYTIQQLIVILIINYLIYLSSWDRTHFLFLKR